MTPEILTDDHIGYPREVFNDIITGNSPYAFYLFQWVPYQTDARRWRLKMSHDVMHKDGRVEYEVWPNGSHVGTFKDDEVAYIRLSRSQFGVKYVDPRAND